MRRHHAGIFVLLVLLCCFPAPCTADASVSITFTLRAPHASRVFLAGSFNRWDPAAHALSGPDPEGNWTISLLLPPGRYEYAFIINGREWVPDPAAASVDDGFGGRNSVLVVPGPGSP